MPHFKSLCAKVLQSLTERFKRRLVKIPLLSHQIADYNAVCFCNKTVSPALPMLGIFFVELFPDTYPRERFRYIPAPSAKSELMQ